MIDALRTFAVGYSIVYGHPPQPPPRPVPQVCMVTPKAGAQAYDIGAQPGYVAPADDDKRGPAPFAGLGEEQGDVFVFRYRAATYRLKDVIFRGTCDMATDSGN